MITDMIRADIDALEDRIEVLFPIADQRKGDTGFGRGYREILEHARNDAAGFAWESARAMIGVVNELLTLMEQDEADRIKSQQEWIEYLNEQERA